MLLQRSRDLSSCRTTSHHRSLNDGVPWRSANGRASDGRPADGPAPWIPAAAPATAPPAVAAATYVRPTAGTQKSYRRGELAAHRSSSPFLLNHYTMQRRRPIPCSSIWRKSSGLNTRGPMAGLIGKTHPQCTSGFTRFEGLVPLFRKT